MHLLLSDNHPLQISMWYFCIVRKTLAALINMIGAIKCRSVLRWWIFFYFDCSYTFHLLEQRIQSNGSKRFTYSHIRVKLVRSSHRYRVLTDTHSHCYERHSRVGALTANSSICFPIQRNPNEENRIIPSIPFIPHCKKRDSSSYW